jgi:hypothetical protein
MRFMPRADSFLKFRLSELILSIRTDDIIPREVVLEAQPGGRSPGWRIPRAGGVRQRRSRLVILWKTML